MAGFDISKIKIKTDPKKQVPVTRRLTDEVITELDPKTGIEPNAELEGKEFLRFPDGTIQMAAGSSHKKGGVKMNIPDGTKILSAKLTLDKNQVKRLEEEFDLKVSTKDTYADAHKKYDKSIGLTKLYDEQEELFKQLKKEQDKGATEGTARINNQYLSDKISGIEEAKKEKEGDRNSFFMRVYNMQEGSKTKENSEGSFAYGGTSMSDFEKICKKHGIDTEVGKKLLGGVIPEYAGGGEHNKYDNGGEVDRLKAELQKIDPENKYKTVEQAREARKKGDITLAEADSLEIILGELEQLDAKPQFKVTTGANTFSESIGQKRELQTSGGIGAAYGEVTKENLPKILANLHRHFPKEVEEELGVKINDDGTVAYGKDLDLSKKLPEVKRLQERFQDKMTSSADVVINNPEYFSQEQIETATKFKESETFDESTARKVDSMLGNVTGTRFNLGLDIVTPEEKEALDAKGITTINQLREAVKTDPDIISAETTTRLGGISNIMTEGADFTLNPIDTEVIPPAADEVKKPEEAPIEDDINIAQRGRLPSFYPIPNQRPLPPSPMDAHAMAQSRLQRIDPIRIGIEPQIQESGERLKFIADQADDLPASQKFAVLANAQASEAKGLNSAITQANMWNAQQQQQAELFNIGQADREGQMKNQNLLDFERRQLTAKANTEEEFRRYFDELKRQRASDFYTRQNYGMIESLTPDVRLSPSLMAPEYDPEDPNWEVEYNKYRTAVQRGQIPALQQMK